MLGYAVSAFHVLSIVHRGNGILCPTRILSYAGNLCLADVVSTAASTNCLPQRVYVMKQQGLLCFPDVVGGREKKVAFSA
jgi:hypothetical protein